MSARFFWAIAVADWGLADWYAAAFDLAPVGRMDPAADGSRVVVLGNDEILIEFKQRAGHVERVADADGCFKVGRFVRSMDTSRDRLLALGAELVTSTVVQPEFGFRFCIVADPEGNLIQLFEDIAFS